MKPRKNVLYKSRDIYLYICDLLAKTFNKLYQRHSSKKKGMQHYSRIQSTTARCVIAIITVAYLLYKSNRLPPSSIMASFWVVCLHTQSPYSCKL